MKIILIPILLLAGCAALRGQERYTAVGIVPTISERIVSLPETPRPGIRQGQSDSLESEPKPKEAMVNYWDLPVDKIATVFNPLSQSIDAHISCYASFPSTVDMTVPAHTSQKMLFTTNATYMNQTLCSITSYEVLR